MVQMNFDKMPTIWNFCSAQQRRKHKIHMMKLLRCVKFGNFEWNLINGRTQYVCVRAYSVHLFFFLHSATNFLFRAPKTHPERTNGKVVSKRVFYTRFSNIKSVVRCAKEYVYLKNILRWHREHCKKIPFINLLFKSVRWCDSDELPFFSYALQNPKFGNRTFSPAYGSNNTIFYACFFYKYCCQSHNWSRHT